MTSFARDQSICADPRETEQLVAAARVLQQCLHGAMSRFVVPDLTAKARPKLTPREVQVLHLVCQGKSSGVIADLINLSTPTVEFHVRNVMNKLGVATRLQAVARAVALRMV